MIKNRLEELSAELSLHSGRFHWAADSAGIMARDAEVIAVQRTRDVRRGEFYMVRQMTERERVNRIIEDLRRYISVLQENRVPNYEEKVKILSLRYMHCLGWNDVAQRVYGNRPDYLLKQSAYRRKMFRRHEAALSEIWHLFESGRDRNRG